ncbi:hypothetical protein GCM10023238_14300 [Streptomyces heliomycini]
MTNDESAERRNAEPVEAVALTAPIDTLLAAAVARRFYLEQRSKVEIAKEFGISRFKVARLLDAAVAHDIVRIDITVPAEIDVPPRAGRSPSASDSGTASSSTWAAARAVRRRRRTSGRAVAGSVRRRPG